MLRAIRSFIRRRVQIDVGPPDIVLDVDSGNNSHSTGVGYACRSRGELITVLG
jgi:hypothetical protein